jgi:hypothetical protein
VEPQAPANKEGLKGASPPAVVFFYLAPNPVPCEYAYMEDGMTIMDFLTGAAYCIVAATVSIVSIIIIDKLTD